MASFSAAKTVAAGLFIAAMLPTQALAASPAASSGGITLSPTLKDISLSSGLLEAHDTITVTNHSGRDFTAVVTMKDLKELNAFGGTSLGQTGLSLEKYGLAKWMTVQGNNTITVPSGQTATLTAVVQNRSDLAPGGHYGAIVLTAGSAAGTSSGRVGFKQELVSLVFVKKLGGANFGLAVQSMKADRKNDIPDEVTLNIRNTGNVHVVPRGYVAVTDPRGTVVAKGIINSDSSIILPEGSRQFVTLMQPVGKADIPGRYKITAYYRYDETSQFKTTSISFTRVRSSPLLLIGVAVSGVVIVGRVVLMRRRHSPYRRR